MIRKAVLMSVNPGQEKEYARRHGVHNYSIFHDPTTHQLFGYVEIEDEARWAAIAGTEVCRRWWKHMRDIMPSNPDNSPVSRDLAEVFHLD
jgi:L-rhamnose mutarotase